MELLNTFILYVLCCAAKFAKDHIYCYRKMQSAAFILLFLCYINGFVRGELLMAQDISTGKVYAIDEQDRDPETALVVELDATTTATCVLENLVALNLTDTKRFIRATDCVSIQHFGFVSTACFSVSTPFIQ